MDPNFYNLSELEPGFYEVEKTKEELVLDLPVHIGVFILNYAKLRMLQFYYDFTDKYLDRSLYEINETDTDSLYMSLAGNSVEELVTPEKKQAFDAEKHLWFVTPQVPQGKRTPRLFKVEYTGTKMVSLCSKSYCIEDTDNRTVKFSMKGVNKNQFDNPMTHYQETLDYNYLQGNQFGYKKKRAGHDYLQSYEGCPYILLPKEKSPGGWTYHSPTGYLRGDQYISPVTKELEYKNIFIISL